MWTEEEVRYLKDYYSQYPLNQVIQHLSRHTPESIKTLAKKLSLKSFDKLTVLWNENELDYIANHWETESDYDMARVLGRTRASIKVKREQLGLYRRDMERLTYPTLSKYLRGQNQKWKKDSMEQCNWMCVLTGSKDFEIHHLYSVSNIINDILTDNESFKDKEFSTYTEDDLSFILSKFLEIQEKYPLGECVCHDLHVLFHSLYGQYYNTPEQWYCFKENYYNGVYDELLTG